MAEQLVDSSKVGFSLFQADEHYERVKSVSVRFEGRVSS